MASTQEASSPGHNVKDALYLVEFLKQNPQAITFNVSPFAEKTGAKVRSIERRLKTIKKRNGLNIVISVNSGSVAAAAGGGGGAAAATTKTAKPKPRVAFKREDDEKNDTKTATGLLSPVESNVGPSETTTPAATAAVVTTSKSRGSGQGQKKRSANVVKMEDQEEDTHGQAPTKRIKRA
ncbi:hypothetical protein H2204_001607 [Knufia peltigerae]|uniref:Uncharacterized protein n=1 Tax=Knufia peltigerae TaxID=1002370 RepID=A0AA38YD26_9EURO|nr:hypothetical protein H2204_001607 [Knufia peltigerae]